MGPRFFVPGRGRDSDSRIRLAVSLLALLSRAGIPVGEDLLTPGSCLPTLVSSP